MVCVDVSKVFMLIVVNSPENERIINVRSSRRVHAAFEAE